MQESPNMSYNEILKEYGKFTVPKIAAFDLDMTVHDIISLYENIVNQTIEFMGYNMLTEEEFRELHKDGFISNEVLFKKIFPGKESVALKFFYDTFHATKIPYQNLLPGATFILFRLKHIYNIKVIGVTNSEQHMAKKALRDLGIFSLFDSITGPKGNRKLKPETELLLIGLNKINEQPNKSVWFTGDAPTDTLCARSAGCTSIRFYNGDVRPEDKYADIFCNSHYKLEKIIGTLLGHYSGE